MRGDVLVGQIERLLGLPGALQALHFGIVVGGPGGAGAQRARGQQQSGQVAGQSGNGAQGHRREGSVARASEGIGGQVLYCGAL